MGRTQAALRAAVAVGCVVLVGGAARTGGLHLSHSLRRHATSPARPAHEQKLSGGSLHPGNGGFHLPVAVLVALAVAALAALLVAVALLVRAIIRTGWRPHLAEFGRDPFDDDETGGVAAPDAELVAQSAVAALAALDAGDDPRSAVIAAYAGMVAALEAAGTRGATVLTPGRLLLRAAAAGLVDGDDASGLTTVFERARFSTQDITALDVAEARARLDAVRTRLLAVVPA
jgi:hypothetical protein